jgi:hypothetical protein
MRLDESLNEEHRKQLWELLEEYWVCAWHKRKLGQCFMGEHVIYTQGLLFCRMTPRWLSYWEKGKVNWCIQALVDLGKMCKSASKYACKVTLLVKKDGSQKLCGDYKPLNF